MEVKKIVEGMTAPQVAQVIDDNFKNQNKILEEDIAKQNNVIGVSEYRDFSEAEAVNVGDVRKYEGFLYECVEATTGAFDASKWKKSSFKAETEKKLTELGQKSQYYSYVDKNGYAYVDSDNVLRLYRCAIVNTRNQTIYWIGSDKEEVQVQLAPFRTILVDFENAMNGAVPVIYEDVSQGHIPNYVYTSNIVIYQGSGNPSVRSGYLINDIIDTTIQKLHELELIITDNDGFAYIDDNNILRFRRLMVANKGNNALVYISTNNGDNSNGYEIKIHRQSCYYVDARALIKGDVSLSDYLQLIEFQSEDAKPYYFAEALPLIIHIGSSNPYAVSTTMLSGLMSGAKNRFSNENYVNREFKIEIESGGIPEGTGKVSNYFWGDIVKRTCRFIKIPRDNKIYIKADKDVYRRTLYYDENFNYLGRASDVFVQKNIEQEFTPKYNNACYFKMVFTSSNLEQGDPVGEVGNPNILLKGVFDDVNEFYNIKYTDSNYIKFSYGFQGANVADSDSSESALKDGRNIISDYGLLALPNTYSNVGKPTRLIIYCHGAGAHIDSSTNEFNKDNMCRPDYWLSQGYAVMDVDGNPFSKSIPHWFIPESLQSYIAGYEWVIRNFNIAKDGVIVGGRSMGGAMALNIITSRRIPVISCFMICPTQNFFHYMNVANAQGRSFVAQHCGFNSDGVTWTSNNPMTSSELKCFVDNFSKLARYTPIWRIITDLPTKDELLNDNFNVQYGTYNPIPEEKSLFDSLHAKCGVPIKFFVSTDDYVAPYKRNAELMYNMLTNGAEITELRKVNYGGHYPEFDENNQIDIVLENGELLNTSIIYIEALNFCKRYEQPH